MAGFTSSSSIWGGSGTYRNPLAPKPAKAGPGMPTGGRIYGGRGVYHNPLAPKPPKGTGAKGTGGGTGSGGAPVKTPSTPGAPTVPTQGGTSTPGTLAPSPYDATYFNQLNAATLNANNKINAYQSDIGNAQTNLNSALQQLQYNQGLAVTKAQDAENARGGFAQGALGQTEGQLAHAYLTTESADQQKFAQQAAAWNQAIAGVRAGLSVQQIALGLASAARQSNLTAHNPAAGPGQAPAGAAGSAGSSGGAPVNGGGGGSAGSHGGSHSTRAPRVAIHAGAGSPTAGNTGKLTVAPRVTIRGGKGGKGRGRGVPNFKNLGGRF